MPMLHWILLIGELLDVKSLSQHFPFLLCAETKNPTEKTTSGVLKHLLINNEAQKQLDQNIPF